MNHDFFTINFFPVVGTLFLILFLWRNSYLELNLRKKFYLLSAAIGLELITYDLEFILGDSSCSSRWLILVCCLGYILRPLMLYLLILIIIRDEKGKRLRILLTIPLAVNTVFSLSGFFTDIVYTYDENNVFQRGPLGWFSHIVMIFYLVLMIALVSRREHHFERVVMLIITAMLITGAFMESLMGNYYVLRIAIAASLLFYYLYFQSNVYKDEMMEKKLEQAKMYKNITWQMVTALAGTVDAKDSYTNGHSQRVADYSREIARRLGKNDDFLRDIYFMGLLHDIGKIGIPDTIINKKGRLTDEEYAIIKMHPVIGSDVLKKITEMPQLYCGARWHHEHYDGTGYPDGIKGKDIPLEARIIAVADAYDAMSSKRSYRDAMKQEDIRKEIIRVKGTQLDPEISDVIIEMIDEDKEYEMREK